ncbi:MAG: hypothetical protein ACI4B3_09170 [Prevotella sp.]
MDYIKFLLLLAIFCCSTSLKAQNTDEDERDLYKENYALKKELAKKDARIKKLEDEIAKIETERNKADSLLKVEKATGKSKEVKSQIQVLEQENKRLKSELDNSISNVEKAINQQTKNSQEQISQLQQQHLADSIEIASLRGDLSELSNFRKMWLTQLAESVNEKWLNKPYSQINTQELEIALKQYDEFASSDKRIADARDKLRMLLTDCQIFNQGVSIVNAPYEKGGINSIAAPLKNLRDKTTDPAKKQELSLLYWQLDNYGVTVEIFQDVIKAVDEQILGMNVHKAAWPLVKAVLDKQEKDDEYITAIKKIPWLSEQFNLYYKSLEKNCVGTNKVHDTIMYLQP